MMTGIMLVPIVGISGLAIDHWAVSTAKSEIENAADAAALAIINRAAAVMRESGNQKLASEIGRNAGHDQFDANVGKIPDTKIEARTTTLSIKGLEFESKITWSARSTTRFSSLFKWNDQALTGVSVASVQLPAYVQIHVLVDNSGSMGIGATKAAQDDLYELSNCAIACHINNSSYRKAKSAGVRTRIDVVREVLIDVGKSASKATTIPNQIKIGVYTFANDFVDMVKINDPEATNMERFEKKMTAELGLASMGGGTDFRGAFKKLYDQIPIGGDGLTESKPLVFVFFITDGIENTTWNRGGQWWQVDPDAMHKGAAIKRNPHPSEMEKIGNVIYSTYKYGNKERRDVGWIQALDDRICEDVKRRGRLLTLEIEYIIPERKYWAHNGGEDVRFGWVRQNILKKEGNYTLSHNRFRKCASSPEDAFMATTDKEIESSIKTMFDKVAPKPPRLLK